MSSPAENLRLRLAQYAYASPTPSPRRGARRPEPVSPTPRRGNTGATNDDHAGSGDDNQDDRHTLPAASPRRTPKRRADGSLEKFGWKKPRGYAEPGTYEHLPHVNDCLGGELKLIFVGINPGKMSSRTGHHFAHPTNKFWRALYMGGLTTRQLTPAEDVTLPAAYGYGMTNLVDRPTAEQAELSVAEMRERVPALVRKLAGERARVACFVGKKIWDIFEGVAGRAARERDKEETRKLSAAARAEVKAQQTRERERARVRRDVARQPPPPAAGVVAFTLHQGEVVKLEPGEGADDGAPRVPEPETEVQPPVKSEPTTPSKRLKTEEETPNQSSSDLPSPSPPLVSLDSEAPAPSPSRSPFFCAVPHSAFAFDAPQRLRLVLPPVAGDDGAESGAASPQYTYFWVVPNTSGLERTPLPRQGALFGRLREFLESLEAGEQPTGEFVDVTVDEV